MSFQPTDEQRAQIGVVDGAKFHDHAHTDAPGGGRAEVCIVSHSPSGALVQWPNGEQLFMPWDRLDLDPRNKGLRAPATPDTSEGA